MYFTLIEVGLLSSLSYTFTPCLTSSLFILVPFLSISIALIPFVLSQVSSSAFTFNVTLEPLVKYFSISCFLSKTSLFCTISPFAIPARLTFLSLPLKSTYIELPSTLVIFVL